MIAALAAAAALSATQIARIDSIVRMVMTEHRISSLSAGAAGNGATLYLRGFGADGFTIYAAGSIAKQFTAAAVLQDVEAGELALDRGDPPLRDLLAQTTGGTWSYQNQNYATLGSILERADDVPYCRLLDARILVPLHLASTSCGPPFGAMNVAKPSGARQAQGDTGTIAPAAGGLWSNVPDLLRWLDDLRAGRVVSPPLVQEMTTSARLPGGTAANYGFGFFVTDWYGYRVAYHDGFVSGYSAVDAISLDDGIALAILSNGDRVDLVPLAKSVFAILDPPRDKNLYASQSSPAENEDPRVTAALRAILGSAAFANFGSLDALEFLERSKKGGLTYDRYRATFASAVRVVTAGYGADAAIVSLTIEAAP